MVGWYLPVQVVAEKQMKRVAVGRTAGGVEQAVGIRCRQEWCRHSMSREQLVGTAGQMVQADFRRMASAIARDSSGSSAAVAVGA